MRTFIAFFLAVLLFSVGEAQDKTVFLGILVKNNDTLIPAFLKSIDRLDYDKKLIRIQIYTYNDTPAVRKQVEKWAEENQTKYSQIVCMKNEDSALCNLESLKKIYSVWRDKK